jgi:hypothetical protein
LFIVVWVEMELCTKKTWFEDREGIWLSWSGRTRAFYRRQPELGMPGREFGYSRYRKSICKVTDK